jgi:hypothetical protein
MPTFSLPIPESSIIKALEGANKVKIMGCGFCDNWSLAYQQNQPAKEIKKEGDKTITTPYALTQHTSNLKQRLKEKDIDSEIEVVPMLCTYTEDPASSNFYRNAPWTQKNFMDRCKDFDAVLCLGCNAAFIGLRKRLDDSVKIVPGMKTVGSLQIQVYLDETGRYELLNKEGSTSIENK